MISKCEWLDYAGYLHTHALRDFQFVLYGEWMPQAGFINGMPVKVRVMRDCIVITPQHTHGLFGCIEGMGVTRINKRSAEQWLKTFPGR